MSKILLSLSPAPPPPPAISKSRRNSLFPVAFDSIFDFSRILVSRRSLILTVSTSGPLTVLFSAAALAEAAAPPPKTLAASNSTSSFLSSIANTKSWFQYYGDGFAIRVPPNFEDITEPEDYNAGLSLYGDKAKPKTYAARFASPDGSEVLSVIIRPTNQLKITFLEAKDIADLGSLKEATKIFVPGGATLYSARNIKVKEDEGYRNYYFYEFGRDRERVALVAAVNSGKAIVAGATAPQSKWEDDGVQLRSAAVSLTVL